MTMVLFVGLVKASQPDMAAAWDETDYVIKSNMNGFNLENKFLWYSIDDSKELERAKSLFQVDEVNIGDIHELIEKAVKLLAIVTNEKIEEKNIFSIAVAFGQSTLQRGIGRKHNGTF